MTRTLLIPALTLAIALVIARETLSPPSGGPPTWPFTDKQLHAMAFALLVLPAAIFTPRAIPLVAALALLYGGAIELVQPLVGRSGEWADLLADAVGIGIGAMPALWRLRPPR